MHQSYVSKTLSVVGIASAHIYDKTFCSLSVVKGNLYGGGARSVETKFPYVEAESSLSSDLVQFFLSLSHLIISIRTERSCYIAAFAVLV